jgi:hypothetical protein
VIQPDGHIMMLDELLEEVNNRAPGFGGMYWHGDGNLVIYVTPKGDNAAIEQAARAVFSDMGWSRVKSIVFRPAAFEVNELQAVRARVPGAVGDSWIWTDLDENSNTVHVAVETGSDLVGAASRMEAVGARPGMVRFEYGQRPKVAAYLDANQRPLTGGVQIEVWDSTRTTGLNVCTFGFNARLSTDANHQYFVTNDHCTHTARSRSCGRLPAYSLFGYSVRLRRRD